MKHEIAVKLCFFVTAFARLSRKIFHRMTLCVYVVTTRLKTKAVNLPGS